MSGHINGNIIIQVIKIFFKIRLLKYRFCSLGFSNQSFTLAEYLIAIAIVAILTILALPRFPQVLEKTRRKEATYMMSEIREAELAYEMENQTFTSVWVQLPWNVSKRSQNYTYWIDDVAGLIRARRVSTAVYEYKMDIITGVVTKL